MAFNPSDTQDNDEMIKRGFAKMTKGGVIMDVTTVEQARVAENAGAVAVMALEKVPADIRATGGVARMADPSRIREIMDAVTIPVMAKVRIGHVSEGYALAALGVDMLDESEVLTPADPFFHLFKRDYKVPFVCGARNIGEAVRRIFEGAAMIRTKGEAGTGNIIEAVRHMRMVNEGISLIQGSSNETLEIMAKKISEPYEALRREVYSGLLPEGYEISTSSIFYSFDLKEIQTSILDILKEIKENGKLPVVNFAAGGIATPADGALMMKLGADGVFVGSGIFKSQDPTEMAKAVVDAVQNYENYELIAQASSGLVSMDGMDIGSIPKDMKLQERGW
ncbi:MAG: pyridoxal 5'-phosphate synthase lyase subunit PdxS [Candidatus Thermoplasmatota archaeon]|nr:pyridoxal 5'-phosphate synthase lyase subunit PdxS [Candidatus Thermoplasmatota archaeon]MCL5730776.1 pyridoxal 5'-phosphate synthase lyase subunit PdxS [Candidatus Thermoplasmatota archaeon]